MRERAALPCAALVHGPLMRVRAVLPCARERRTQAADGRTRWSGWLAPGVMRAHARTRCALMRARACGALMRARATLSCARATASRL